MIGNCLQEWFPNWFKYLGVNVLPGANTQAFPDFVAAFDLANFQNFLETTLIILQNLMHTTLYLDTNQHIVFQLQKKFPY